METFAPSTYIYAGNNQRSGISGHGSVESCEFSDEGVHEFRGGGTGGFELRFQLVHQGHQLIDLGHDPALFGEGWNGNGSTGLVSI